MKFSEAEETEVLIDVETDALTRFANNMIHQNVAEQGINISVRAVMENSARVCAWPANRPLEFARTLWKAPVAKMPATICLLAAAISTTRRTAWARSSGVPAAVASKYRSVFW